MADIVPNFPSLLEQSQDGKSRYSSPVTQFRLADGIIGLQNVLCYIDGYYVQGEDDYAYQIYAMDQFCPTKRVSTDDIDALVNSYTEKQRQFV